MFFYSYLLPPKPTCTEELRHHVSKCVTNDDLRFRCVEFCRMMIFVALPKIPSVAQATFGSPSCLISFWFSIRNTRCGGKLASRNVHYTSPTSFPQALLVLYFWLLMRRPKAGFCSQNPTFLIISARIDVSGYQCFSILQGFAFP